MDLFIRKDNFKEKEKRNVSAYVRVSTSDPEQKSSYDSQLNYYRSLIESSDCWAFSGIYADTATGTGIRKRKEFMKMIDSAIRDNTDIILCKSISRWARNIVDALRSINILRSHNITVIFEEEKINTSLPDDIYRLNLAASVVQHESEANSENHKWVYRHSAMSGIHNVGSNHYFGYDGHDKTLKPNGAANMVKAMFSMFLDGAGYSEIAQFLNREGYKTVRGNDFTSRAVRDILKNEIYTGDMIFQKSPSRNIITGEIDASQTQRKVSGHHVPIIDLVSFNKAQCLMKKKYAKYGKRKKIASDIFAL